MSGPLHLFLGLARARTSGLQEGVEEDPFIHVPRAIQRLELRCDQTDADALITAQEWVEVQEEAREEARNTEVTTPDVFAAACVALEKYTLDEECVLHAALVAIGMADSSAADMARRTATAGFAITTTGDDQEWARLLARGNRSSLHALGPKAQDLARQMQASVMRRFMRISHVDDIESAQEEVTSFKNFLRESVKPAVSESKVQDNPYLR